jgi:DNA-directed RNA polymerase specialized sigma subunit
MIETDAAYRNAVDRLKKDQEYLTAQRVQLEQQGLTEREIVRVLEPQISFYEQLKDEVAWYESARRGDPQAVDSLKEIGRLLIALRIASGVSQQELAERLHVHESQLSRDERNEYFGISVDRAQEIVDALRANISVTARVERSHGGHVLELA